MIGGLPSLWQLGLHMLTVHIQCACANWKVIPVHSLTWKRGKVVVAVTRDTVSLLPACQTQTETWDTNITDDYCIPAISNTPLCTHSMAWAASNLVAFYSKHASHTQARMTCHTNTFCNTTVSGFSATCLTGCGQKIKLANMTHGYIFSFKTFQLYCGIKKREETQGLWGQIWQSVNTLTMFPKNIQYYKVHIVYTVSGKGFCIQGPT